MATIANKQPRGWVVAARPAGCCAKRCALCKLWTPAYEGAVFADKAMAMRKADLLRSKRNDLNVRVLREGVAR